jgi:hypothetical protein
MKRRLSRYTTPPRRAEDVVACRAAPNFAASDEKFINEYFFVNFFLM